MPGGLIPQDDPVRSINGLRRVPLDDEGRGVILRHQLDYTLSVTVPSLKKLPRLHEKAFFLLPEYVDVEEPDVIDVDVEKERMD